MISVMEAERLILDSIPSAPDARVPLAEATGEVLREPVVADRPLPPYHRVAMDGIAVATSSWARGVRAFPVAGIQRAGAPGQRLDRLDGCLEVMTGAVLPTGCDAVIPVERLTLVDGVAHVLDVSALDVMANVHVLGSDRSVGSTLLRPGLRLLGPQIAVAASVGCAKVRVAARPRVALISTGDELVDIAAVPLAHQVRRSNADAMRAALTGTGFTAVRAWHVIDDQDAIRDALIAALADSQFVIISGGVSEGRYDHVPAALAALGVAARLHKVRQRPGKPLWFGVGPAGQAVFGLPGNPVSAVVCLYRYVLPALWRHLGARVPPPAERPRAVLAEDVRANKPLTLFVPVRVHEDAQGRRVATPVPMNGSGDLAGLATSDGVLELPDGGRTFAAGEAHVLWRWSEPQSLLCPPLPEASAP